MKRETVKTAPLRNKPALLIAVAGVVAGASGTVRAQEAPGYEFKMFVGGAYVEPLSDSALPGVANKVEASSELGLEIGGEWRASDRLGLEVAYLDAQHDVEANGSAIGEIDLRPWNFTLNFHVVDRDAFNWYVGPTLSYVDWSDVTLTNGARLGVDSQTTWGVSTGMLFGLGDTLGLEIGFRYLDASVDSPSLPDEVSVDPLFARVGVSFRF
jgi:outer membrane protein W